MRAADISTRGTTSEGARNATARSQQVKASRKFREIRIVGYIIIKQAISEIGFLALAALPEAKFLGHSDCDINHPAPWSWTRILTVWRKCKKVENEPPREATRNWENKCSNSCD